MIIVGAGSIGQPLIQIATGSGHEVVVIEREADRAGDTAETYDCLVLHADATLKETLVEAGAHEADAIISTTDHVATNIMVCLPAVRRRQPRHGMIIGGAVGSTVGGIKLLRVIYLVRSALWRVRTIFEPPHAVKVFRIGDRTLQHDAFEEEAGRAAGLFFLWVVGLAASTLLMVTVLGGEHTLTDVIFESASAQDTVGLSTGLTGPDMPRAVEVTFIVQMWLGRLEIISVLVFLRTLLVRHP